MKRKLFLLLAASSLTMFVACNDKNDDDANQNSDQSKVISTETTPEFDNSNFGLYKGVIVGSTGTIKIVINNGDDVAKAFLKIDDTFDTLTCETSFTKGVAVLNALFISNKGSSVTFSVDADGKNPDIGSITIQGHNNVVAVVLKETSTDIAYCYEGTSETIGFSYGGEFYDVANTEYHLKWTFNIVRLNNYCFGIDDDGNMFEESVENDKFNYRKNTEKSNRTESLTASITFEGDSCSGDFKIILEAKESPETFTLKGRVSGKRTL